jgi:uncharacterized phage-associated protein
MKYDIEKLADILNVFFKNGQELTKLRICKLLYFIDKLHLQKYGRFVLEDKYHNLPLGQIPSLTLDILNDFFEPSITFRGKPVKSSNDLLKEYFVSSKHKDKYLKMTPKKDFSFNSLSASEIAVINEVLKKIGKYSTGHLLNLAHNEATSKKTPVPQQINRELFLDDLSESEKRLINELMMIDEADDALTDCLNR